MPIQRGKERYAVGDKVSLTPHEAESISRGPYPAVEPLKETEAAPEKSVEADGTEGDQGDQAKPKGRAKRIKR